MAPVLTVIVLLLLAAFVITIATTFSPPKAQLWIAVLLVILVELLRVLPVGK
jgi:hypothetical protein